ncbi:hypothetical protein [Chelativorans salis]|uniref:Uncharacterized protein n=1 Tax=Chelativorans salis TaxID=2978478 RepID=A0ABT2LUD0_9HYPH|nr:hypothetical protein [Chelativorans sp. EGI FJ00035]MCT7378145.1 hypothetical protein [Chelativorans sp. EGI FJ00035]
MAATALFLLAVALPASGDERRVVEVSLVDGVASGAEFTDSSGSVPTLVVDQGDSIELRWTSDRAMALHLHGYDLEAEVEPETEATVSFDARAAGRFLVSTLIRFFPRSAVDAFRRAAKGSQLLVGVKGRFRFSQSGSRRAGQGQLAS